MKTASSHPMLFWIDLGTQEIETLTISDDDQEKYIGGSTLAAKLIYDYVKPGMDPAAPENPLIFATGPFTGSNVPMVSRAAICGISPGTGLWGKDDIYKTQTEIKREIAEKISIACIGKAGENGINFSNIMNDEGRAAGRCGMGALMGSKNLKALVVSGSQKAKIAYPVSFKKVISQARDTIKSNAYTQAYKLYGTNFYMDLAMRLGDAPAKYFTKSVFPAAKIHGPAFRDRYHMGNYACSGCPIGCGRVIKDFMPDSETTIKQVDGPEYETVGAFGPLCMNFDIDSIVMANHLCNAHGLDTISAGVSIAFAMHLYEKGILTKETAGMEIRWGDAKTLLSLLEMIPSLSIYRCKEHQFICYKL